MDIATADDLRAAGGVRILEGRSRAAATSPGKLRMEDDGHKGASGGGLGIGRRQLMVVQPPPPVEGCVFGGSSGSKGGKATEVVRVVDHGETQKLAVRHLFDAEIILRSYEEELEEKNAMVHDLQTLLRSKGWMPQDNNVKVAVEKEAKRTLAMGLAGSGLLAEQVDAAQLRRFQKQQEEDAAQKDKSGEDASLVDYDNRSIPFWLRNDERSRKSIENLRAHLMRAYADAGQLTNATALNHLWQCGLDFALRWGGRVGESVLAQNEAIEASNRKTKRDALRESSQLRQHIKNMEKRYKELFEQAKKLQQQLREATAQPRFQSSAPPPQPKGSAELFEELPPQQANDMARQIVDQWMGGGQSQPWPGTAERTAEGNPEDGHGRFGEGGASADAGPTSFMHAAGAGAGAGPGGFSGGRPGGGSWGDATGGAGGSGAGFAAFAGGPGGPGGRPSVGNVSGGTGSVGGDGRSHGHGYGHGHGNSGYGNAGNSGVGIMRGTRGPSGGYGPGGGGGMGQGSTGGLAVPGFAVTGQSRGSGSRPPSNRPPSGLSSFQESRFGQVLTQPTDGAYKPLEDDDNIDINLDKAELEQMDNEIFELFDTYDADMKEMLIDAVNEKVRRILMLDPSKFQNGKLPFGLRPDNMGVGRDELNRLRRIIEQLQDELDGVRKERDLLKSRLEAMESRIALAPRAVPPPVQMTDTSTSFSSLGRGKLSQPPSPTSPASDTPMLPPSPKEPRGDMMSREEFEQQLAEATRDLLSRLAELEARLRDAEARANRPAQVVEKEVVVEREVLVQQEAKPITPPPEPDPLLPELEQVQQALCHSQHLLRRVLGEVSLKAQKTGSKGQTAVEALIGKHGAPVAEVQAHVKAVSPFGIWAQDVLAMIRDDLVQEVQPQPEPPPSPIKAETPPKPRTPPPAPALAPAPAPEVQGDSEETLRLRKLCKAQEEEIARLLLLVDELRKRLEAMGEHAAQEPSSPVAATMEKFGLKEIAKARQPHKLRGVFERLYLDACQRITRYTLIRQRMLATNALCNQVVAALAQPHTESAEAIPDFERLNATASAALKGMYYPTDYLFRATCEYAMSQGIENTLFRAQQHPPDWEAEDTEQPEPEEPPQRGGRLPGRRSERPRPKVSSPAGPTRPKRVQPPPPPLEPSEPTSFGQYVAALREANLDEEWSKGRRERSFNPNNEYTVKAALEHGKDTANRKPGGLVTSQSLPALPRGRNLYQTADTTSPVAKSVSDSRQM